MIALALIGTVTVCAVLYGAFVMRGMGADFGRFGDE